MTEENISDDRYEELEKVLKFDEKKNLYLIFEKDPIKKYRVSLVSADTGHIIRENKFETIIKLYNNFSRWVA
jgi:uncharacterized FlaG/YvyC family protein